MILFGCDDNLPMFISELRREAVTGDSYHPIVIVAEKAPLKWVSIINKYNDIYFLCGDIASSEIFKALNIENAFSFILMCVKNQNGINNNNTNSANYKLINNNNVSNTVSSNNNNNDKKEV